MIPLRSLVAVGLSAVLLGACLNSTPDALKQVPDLPPAESRLAKSLPLEVTPMAASSVPVLVYPDEIQILIEREVLLHDDSESAVMERLSADGTGQFLLEPLSYRSSSQSVWGEVPDTTELLYRLRGRFLVLYRDVHLGHPLAYGSNYNWYVDSEPHLVAGRETTMWSARSVHGFGGADLLIDNETGVLLGWVLYGADLEPQVSCTPTLVDFDPEHGDLSPQEGGIELRPYDAEKHLSEMSFEPRTPQYLPPGYYLEREDFAASGPQLGNELNAHIAVYHDGLRELFVVQRPADVAGPTPSLIIDTVRRSRFGGMELVEGVSHGHEMFVVSGLPSEELQTVFGSLIY